MLRVDLNLLVVSCGWLHKLAVLGAIGCAVVMVLTGFAPLVTGMRMGGYALMLHVSCAPVFVLCMAYLSITLAQNHCFMKEEGIVCWLKKGCFWMLVFLVLPLTLSIVLSMFPLFGTHGQERLFDLHRYSAMALTIVSLVFTGLMITQK